VRPFFRECVTDITFLHFHLVLFTNSFNKNMISTAARIDVRQKTFLGFSIEYLPLHSRNGDRSDMLRSHETYADAVEVLSLSLMCKLMLSACWALKRRYFM